MGVASTSKEKTIRVFNKKDHYDQWQFVYNPAMDRGGLLTGPGQPAALGVGTPAAGAQAAGGPGAVGGIGGQPGQNPGQPITQPPQMPPEQPSEPEEPEEPEQ